MQLPATFGKYELLERIATGGMAEVWLARSFGVAGFEKRLVIKRLRPELAEDPRFVQMFIAEARIGVHLNHPNVVQVYELGRVGALHYIAMEHLHGRDLTRLIRQLRARGDRIPLPVAVAIVAEACRGLAYAHGRTGSDGLPLGLVHRDVSPHNILVTFAGEVKLVDFGIARLMTTATASGAADRKPGPGGGKYAYMSPEQSEGGPIDLRSDLFSAGIVLWELIVGHRLFQDKDHNEKLRRVREAVIPHPSDEGVPVDDGLWAVLKRSLARDPADRYDSASALEEDLRAWLFEQRHRVGRKEIADLLRGAFPDEADRGPAAGIQLEQLLADVQRLDPLDHTPSSETPSRRPSSLPGHLVNPVGERRPVVVLMIDLDGLTELSARVDPEALLKRKFTLLRAIRRVVDRHGGLVQRAVDDHVTVLFGVPRTRTDDVAHALECALDLQANVGQLRKVGTHVELAIGVHTGEVTISRVGHKVRYVARGDTTRFARRMSAVADHGQILVSERVLASVEGWYRVRSGPGVPCRGGKPDVPSYLLEGRARGLRGSHLGSWLRRGDELVTMRTALLALGSQRGGTLRLVGGVGTGKSRFIREIREIVIRRGASFYGVRCTTFGTQRPLEHLRDLVAAVLGVDPDASPTELEEATARLQHLGLGQRDRTVLADLLTDRSDRAEPSEIWHAAAQMLRGLGKDRPAIVAFDDIHALSDADRRELLELLRSLEDLPILFLLATRGIHDDALASHGPAVHLGTFTPELVERLVETRLDVKAAHPGLVALLERTCEGNPRYLEEMLKFLAETGRLVVENGTAVLALPEGDEQAALPPSLQALVTARIDALDAASRGLLQLAAVAGPSFSEALLAEAAGLPDPKPLLLDLASHGLLVRESGSAGEWSFASDLVREAALRGTLGVQRRDYHRLVATALEAVYAEHLEPHFEALTAHCAEGGRPLDAARYAHKAGQRLEGDHFLDRARRCYALGLEQLKTVAVNGSADDYDARVQGEAMLEYRLGAIELTLGNAADGHRHLRLALDVASEQGLPWIETRIHVALGRSYLQEGRIKMAEAHLQQARAILRAEPDPEVERDALEAMALLAFDQGRNEEAEKLWTRALALADGDAAAEARCRIGLANRHLRSADPERATEHLERALVIARASGDRILEGRVLNNFGLVHAWSGRTAEALRSYRAALELREGLGYTRGVVVNHHNIGDLHFHAGDYAKAWMSFQRSRELAEEVGWERGVALNDVFLAYLAHRKTPPTDDATPSEGDGAEAVLRATDRARRLGDGEIVVTGLWLTGRWLLENGRPDEARERLCEALGEARQLGLQPMLGVLEDLLSRVERVEA